MTSQSLNPVVLVSPSYNSAAFEPVDTLSLKDSPSLGSETPGCPESILPPATAPLSALMPLPLSFLDMSLSPLNSFLLPLHQQGYPQTYRFPIPQLFNSRAEFPNCLQETN